MRQGKLRDRKILRDAKGLYSEGAICKCNTGVLVDGPGLLWILRDSVLRAASGDEN